MSATISGASARRVCCVTSEPNSAGRPTRASVVIEDGVVIAVGWAGAIADERIDAEGACVLPGFVGSHTSALPRDTDGRVPPPMIVVLRPQD